MLMQRAQRLLPGGVDSPVRAFSAVGGTPPFFRRADGAHVYDEDGNAYVDMVLAYGPHILGHQHPAVVAALARQLDAGTAFGGPTALQAELAERGINAVPSAAMGRF